MASSKQRKRMSLAAEPLKESFRRKPEPMNTVLFQFSSIGVPGSRLSPGRRGGLQRRLSLVAVNGDAAGLGRSLAAIHPRGREAGQAVAPRSHQDDSAGAAELADFGHHRVGDRLRLLPGQSPLARLLVSEAEPGADLVRYPDAQEIFAGAGGRHRAGPVVGIGAGADDR